MLPKPLPRVIVNFRFLADRCTTLDQLAVVIEEVALALDFEFLAMLHNNSLLRQSDHLIRHDTYPPGWERILVGRGQRVIDPVLAYAQRTNTGFTWPHFPRRFPLTRSQEEIFEQGLRFGLRQGFTVPANVPGEPAGSITFATRRTRTIGRERQLIINSIGGIAFEAARRIKGLTDGPSPVPHLSERERECVYWIAHGLSDKQVARTLGIAHATVRTHVRRAFDTLGVFTRQQLVYEALRLGLIEFDENVAYPGD